MFFDTIFFIQFAIYKGNKPREFGDKPKTNSFEVTDEGKGMLDVAPTKSDFSDSR